MKNQIEFNIPEGGTIVDSITLKYNGLRHYNIKTMLKQANDLASLNDEFENTSAAVVYRKHEPILAFIKLDPYTNMGETCIVIDYVNKVPFINDLTKCDFTDVIHDYLLTDKEKRLYEKLAATNR